MTAEEQPGADTSTVLRRHWSRLGERGAYLGLRLMLMAYRLFGRTGFSLLLYPVIAYFFLVGTVARRASREFLARVYAQPCGRQVLGSVPGWRHSFRHFLCFGEAVLDKLAAWMGDIRLDQIVYENRSAFEALLHAGRGGVLIASHLGNIEVTRALATVARGLKITVLVDTRHSENFNRLMRRASPDAAVSLIQAAEIGPTTAMVLRERVARGEFVVIAGDRTPPTGSRRVTWVPFLGQPAPFPQGPFVLAALLECPVQLIFCFKRGGRYHVIFEPLAEIIKMPRRARTAALEPLIACYATRLGHHCLEMPYQWFNFFDFWAQAERPPSEKMAAEPRPTVN